MHIHKSMQHFHLKHRPHKVDEMAREEILNQSIWKLFAGSDANRNRLR